MRKILYMLLVGVMFTSCDSFLDEAPTKSSAKTLETVEELDALFNGVTYSYQSEPNIFCTDNFEIPLEVYNESPSDFDYELIGHYLFSTNNDQGRDFSWNQRYYTIWFCNYAISVIKENSITGSEVLKKQLLAEAHFLRAYLYFELAIDYCLHPSVDNADELGLPLRTETNFEENLSRAPLATTYEFIESDLEEALKMDVSFDRNWRGSTAAVKALAARYFLYKGDYTKASQYATDALSEHSEMIDYDAEFYTITDSKGLDYPMTNNYRINTSQWLNFWKGQYMNRCIINSSWRTIPSRELLDLYDPLDKRYEMFIVENYMKHFGLENNQYFGYIQGGNYDALISGPSTAEMYLISAETKARSGDIAGAMVDVEKVRINRFAASDYTVLALPADKKSAIQTVIDERRREMPFTIRWYDIRRLNVDPETDNITIRRKFYPIGDNQVNMEASLIDYVIEPSSRLYARPLNSEVINLSDGQTVQNNY